MRRKGLTTGISLFLSKAIGTLERGNVRGKRCG
jgi:hypothetical protein